MTALNSRKNRLINICRYGNLILISAFCVFFFFYPAYKVASQVNNPDLAGNQPPSFAFDWHASLSPKIALWAKDRVASASAKQLSIHDISGTEWPVFSAVFYLWATEALQHAWENDKSLYPTSPKEHGGDALKAAVTLIADPNHAHWVKVHWGEDYLDRENLFYRMLLISGLTSYQSMTGDTAYQPTLKDQTTRLAAELDQSPHGLLDDYPGQCYPIDIVPAIAVIQRSAKLLNIDLGDFITQSIRGFSGDRLDPETELPAYIADAKSGQGIGPARGVGISYMLIWAAELWPEVAKDWYQRYQTHFWQTGLIMSGIRELSRFSNSPEWWVEVDSAPVVAGYGTAARAYGIGAARANAQHDHAYQLGIEALAVAWPLPDGTLLIPRLLSNLADAPYVGESALLFNYTRSAKTDIKTNTRLQTPRLVYLTILLYFVLGSLSLLSVFKRFKSLGRYGHKIKYPGCQFCIWVLLLFLVGALTVSSNIISALLCGLLMLMLPRGRIN